jgi:hypothetical protein
MIEEGSIVEVVQSKSGYTGKGEALSIAYQDFWLVKILEKKQHVVNPVILVKAANLRLISVPTKKEKKKKDQE